jgi:hypothetical protein
MKCLHLTLVGLVLSSLSTAAWGVEPYYSSPSPYGGGSYNLSYGVDDNYGPSYNRAYSVGSGYGGYQGCGWLTPGCCAKPWSPYDNVWDGYCDERYRHWGWLGGCGQTGCGTGGCYGGGCTSGAPSATHSDYHPSSNSRPWPQSRPTEATNPAAEQSSLEAPAPPPPQPDLSAGKSPSRSTLRMMKARAR